jgi:hypothetical protein
MPEQTPPALTHVAGVAHLPKAQTPEQHSEGAPQSCPLARQAPQVPPTHAPEQHPPADEQLAPLARQAPAPPSGPPSTSPPGPASGAGKRSRQEKPPSSPLAWQASPLQQASGPVAPGVQLEPAATQDCAWQTYFPLTWMQGLRLQHWSRNWHSSPSSMQQLGSSPFHPLGQTAPPPKHRERPALSSRQTSFCPSQQACSQLAPWAPQQLPTGWHACLLLQRPMGGFAVASWQTTPLEVEPQQSSSLLQSSPLSRQPEPTTQLGFPVPRSMHRWLQQPVESSQGSPPMPHAVAPGTVTSIAQVPGPLPASGRRQTPLQQSTAL